MEKLKFIVGIIFVLFMLSACEEQENQDKNSDILTLTGQFETSVQGYSLLDFLKMMPYVTFNPQNIEGNENMQSYADTNGYFTIKLIKGETYNNMIHLKMHGGSALWGHIKFSSIDGNELTIPANAGNSINLGKLYLTQMGVWVTETPLPWLTEGVIDIKNNTAPVINSIDKNIYDKYDASNNYIGSNITFTATSGDNDIRTYLWVLEDTDGHASFAESVDFFKMLSGSKSAIVYTDAQGGHGKLTVAVIDTLGWNSKKTVDF